MKAGIDFGSSLVKAVWMEDGEYQYLSTADVSFDEMVQRLKENGVRQLNMAGTGSDKEIKGFVQKVKPGDFMQTIQYEIEMQAKGAREMTGLDEFLLVSIGSGTSFTLVKGDEVDKYPVGLQAGGRSLECKALLYGAKSMQEVADSKGTYLDLLIRDVFHEAEGLFGDFVIASFGKATKDSKKEDVYATLVKEVTDLVAMKMLDIQNIGYTAKNIVYIGTAVGRIPRLKTLLGLNTFAIGDMPGSIVKTSHFPEKGEYALALGAYHMED